MILSVVASEVTGALPDFLATGFGPPSPERRIAQAGEVAVFQIQEMTGQGSEDHGVEAWPRPDEHHSGPLGRCASSSRTMFMNSSPCSMASSTATWVCRATACQRLGMRAFTALR